MSDNIITVEGLGKRYWIRHEKQERYTALRDVLADKAGRLFRRMKLGHSPKTNTPTKQAFWALRDISFELKRGEVLGIIGRNGAGKSTLLKVLSQITEPTEGRARIGGRVASLLEVGTGFHPELTGRENIFLNGAILGMTRAEIRRKFDEIVAFAEVEKFLDTPVKRYSSGMYVRLAFAVAAHLEPEILVVDEVLAVGDVEFQKKCMGKMAQVTSTNGKTVLFVSHNVAAIEKLCTTVLYLKQGRCEQFGRTTEVVKQYLNASLDVEKANSRSLKMGSTLEVPEFRLDSDEIHSGQPLQFNIHVTALEPEMINEAAIVITNSDGHRVSLIDLRPTGMPTRLAAGQSLSLNGTIRTVPFVEGRYSIGFYVSCLNYVGWEQGVMDLLITSRENTSEIVPFPAEVRGCIELDFTARLQKDHQNAA